MDFNGNEVTYFIDFCIHKNHNYMSPEEIVAIISCVYGKFGLNVKKSEIDRWRVVICGEVKRRNPFTKEEFPCKDFICQHPDLVVNMIVDCPLRGTKDSFNWGCEEK